MKKLKRLPRYVSSSVESIEEEIWQYTRTDYFDDSGLSEEEGKALRTYVLKLLNKAITRSNKETEVIKNKEAKK